MSCLDMAESILPPCGNALLAPPLLLLVLPITPVPCSGLSPILGDLVRRRTVASEVFSTFACVVIGFVEY